MIKYDRVTRPNPHDDEDEEAEEYEREDGRGLRRSAAPAARGVKEEDGEVGNRRNTPSLKVIHLQKWRRGWPDLERQCLIMWLGVQEGGGKRRSTRKRTVKKYSDAASDDDAGDDSPPPLEYVKGDSDSIKGRDLLWTWIIVCESGCPLGGECLYRLAEIGTHLTTALPVSVQSQR
jgi:hypothetical protein